MKKKYLLIAGMFAFFFSLLVISCEDKIEEWVLTPAVSHIDGGYIAILDDGSVVDTLDTPKLIKDGKRLSIAAIISESGLKFDRWEGDLTGIENPTTIMMDGHLSITAVFKLLPYSLSVSTTGDGNVTEEIVLGKTTDYGHGSNIRLFATPDTGWGFDHWEGDLTGTDNPVTINMDGHKSVTAVFKLLQYPLSISIIGDGNVTEEIVLGKTTDYGHGSNIRLFATPNSGWGFDHWEGDLTGTANPATVNMDSHKSVTAVFVKIPFAVNFTITGNGSVEKNPNKGTYYYNEVVKLTAKPSTGWVFKKWQGDITGTTNPYNLTINGNKNIEAVFVPIYYLTTQVSGSGTITKDPNKNTYNVGDQVRLTATPNSGWGFDHWEGDLTGTANPATVNMDSHKSVTAVFVKIPFAVNFTITGNGSVEKNPNKGTYYYNEVVKLTAKPSTGWVFKKWQGDITGTTNPYNLTINGNKNIEAVFVPIYYLTTQVSGSGTITKDPNKNTYNVGDQVRLIATPNSGWGFDHWEGDLTGTANPATVNMDGDKSVTAVYVDVQTGYKTENVIIVVQDGARYSETWGDPSHQYIPRLDWMSSYGVISTQFYNNGPTETTSGHTSITTGIYQVINNEGDELPQYPSIFQYWRKENSSTSNKAWVITSKHKLDVLGDCQQYDWKGKYIPSLSCGIYGGNRDDGQTYNKVIDVLSNDRPRLVLVNFQEPDKSGHSGVWANYVEGIRSTDEYIYQIWNYINNDSNYKGKTTMFVTNDHGRHVDSIPYGFYGHGDSCEGCRHIYLYSYGPDFKNGLITNVKRELIDISATAAELLQFDQNYGNGNIMYELFK